MLCDFGAAYLGLLTSVEVCFHLQRVVQMVGAVCAFARRFVDSNQLLRESKRHSGFNENLLQLKQRWKGKSVNVFLSAFGNQNSTCITDMHIMCALWQAEELCRATGNKAACYFLAQQFAKAGCADDAVHFFTKAGSYGSAIRVCKVLHVSCLLFFSLAKLHSQLLC